MITKHLNILQANEVRILFMLCPPSTTEVVSSITMVEIVLECIRRKYLLLKVKERRWLSRSGAKK